MLSSYLFPVQLSNLLIRDKFFYKCWLPHLSYVPSLSRLSCFSLFEHQMTCISRTVPLYTLLQLSRFLSKHPQFIFYPYTELCNLLVCCLFMEFCVFRRVCKIAKTSSSFVMSVCPLGTTLLPLV